MNTLRRIWARWWGLGLTGALAASALLAPRPAAAQFCSNCIYNSAAPQNAQFNITSATIRGLLTVGQLNISTVSASTGTFGVVIASGQYLTNLNASQLLLGIVPGARISGAYSGLTGVGTIATGVWNGSPVATQYGGTGQNFVTASTGSIPYFSNVGVMSALPPASSGVLITQGATLPPVWTASPAITGANVTAIPLANLNSGNLPAAIVVNDVNITTVAASKVIGNISGGAAFLTVPLPIGNLAGGTLPTSNAASSVTAIVGLQPGTFGGPNNMAQFHVNYDGRISTAAQFNLIVYSTQIAPGPLPPSVTIAAAQITSGTLANNVIASSLAANGVAAGTYGGPTTTAQLTVGLDGRITTATQFNIPGLSTYTAFVNVDNNWSHDQTSQQGWTIKTSSFSVGGTDLIVKNSGGGIVGIGGAPGVVSLKVYGAIELSNELRWTTTNTADIGQNSATSPRSVYVGTSFIAPAFETATTPAYSFVNHADTGFYLVGAGTLAFTTEGIQRMTIGSSTMNISVPVSANSGIFIPAGKQMIVGTNAAGGTGTAFEADEANAGALVHFRNATTGALFRFGNGGSIEQGIFADGGNDGTDANSTLRLTNQGAFKLLWVGNGGKIGVGTETPISKVEIASGTLSITGTNANFIVYGGSATASAFFGDGSHLTGIGTSINGLTMEGAQSNTALRSLVCAVIPCQANSTTDFDIYTATGTGAGQWRNSRTGIGP